MRGGTIQIAVLAWAFALSTSAVHALGTATLATDIRGDNVTSAPQGLAVAGGALFFTAIHEPKGPRLWVSDGTETGTRPACPDEDPMAVVVAAESFVLVTSGPSFLPHPRLSRVTPTQCTRIDLGFHLAHSVAIDDTMFFASNSGETAGLWRLDALGSLTHLTDTAAASDSITALHAASTRVYFVTRDHVGAHELWTSDGTPEGTVMLRRASSTIGIVATSDDSLFFSITTGQLGERGLWRSDGTVAGTVFLNTILPDSSGSLSTMVGDTLFFSSNGTLWQSDGSVDGTVAVKTIATSDADGVAQLTPLGSGLVFTANDGDHGVELWFSDGTEAGTRLLKDIRPGPLGALPLGLTSVGDTVYFAADDGSNGFVLWKTDGTEAGTLQVAEVPMLLTSGGFPFTRPNRGFVFGELSPQVPVRALAFGDELVFVGRDPSIGFGLWRTDGTFAGTRLVKGLAAPSQAGIIGDVAKVGDSLFFAAADNGVGVELFVSHGNVDDIRLVADLHPGFDGSFPADLVALDDRLLFSTAPGFSWRLWSASRTNDGIVALAGSFDLSGTTCGRFASVPGTSPCLVRSGRRAFTIRGSELWGSDGTAEGTGVIAPIPQGVVRFDTLPLMDAGGSLFFLLPVRPDTTELWHSDGTSDGTKVAHTFAGSTNLRLATSRGLAFVRYTEADSRVSLLRSDGTRSGSFPVASFLPDTSGQVLRSARLENIVDVGDWLVFTRTSADATELWRSDGTVAGTYPFFEFAGPRSIYDVAAVGRRLFFQVSGEDHDVWSSDGTRSGTLPIAESASSFIGEARGQLVFNTQPGHLWASDGTASGTREILRLSPTTSDVSQLLTMNGMAYVVARDSEHGRQIWKAPLETIAPACAGDCNDDGEVSIDELVRATGEGTEAPCYLPLPATAGSRLRPAIAAALLGCHGD